MVSHTFYAICCFYELIRRSLLYSGASATFLVFEASKFSKPAVGIASQKLCFVCDFVF